ncbi:MAG: NAD-dependent epimerase/dehydratase family protein [Acidimicrobiales bacterium]
MKVFVAGATGVLGRRSLTRLVAAGHEVTAIARTSTKAELVRDLGATPVLVDLFDLAAVTEAARGHDVVCNLATHIPPLSRAARASAWDENVRIRTEGSTVLVDAALAVGARRYVQESIAFLYEDGGDKWLDEATPFAPSPFGASVAAAEANAARVTAAGGTGVVLRFGLFYGADAGHTITQLGLARAGIAPAVGAASGYRPMIHLDDAAAAVVAALDAPAGIYNIVEDRPGTGAEQAAAIAAALGVAPLWYPPAATTKFAGSGIQPLARSQRVANTTFREATGWAPAYPDQWSGWAQVVGPVAPAASEQRRRLVVRVSLAFLAVQAGVLGLWATFAPHSWYQNFPGAGRHWVAVDGPYNHHLVTDVGAFTLALLVVTVVALVGRSRALTRTAGAAWVVSGLPHLVYHLTHRHGLGTGDQLASYGGLAFEVALGLLVIFAAPPTRVATQPVASTRPLQSSAA